ncbi:transcriptional repressor [Halobaculum sp. MBLA0147]|uniref:transcriptional repressor n=1 Tax=Halobaculum sp. MBLA0147 TaxID=3079934 RepID=UPI00352354F3
MLAVVADLQVQPQSPTGSEVITYVRDYRDMSVSQSTVYDHLNQLASAGYLEVTRRGNTKRYRLSPVGTQALQTHMQTLSSLCR